MICRACQSATTSKFPSEINIHFPGRENLETPTVWIFPKLLVCLNCGFTEFLVPEPQLQSLAAGSIGKAA